MPSEYLCPPCLAAGVKSELTTTDDFLVACSFCGAINEKATYTRNAVDVSERFGTLAEGHGIQFRELREKKHEQFVDQLLHAYLVDPVSRIVERSAEHFKAGARAWYNRMRSSEHDRRKLKAATTNSTAQKVKYRVACSIHFAIQESNVQVVRNRLGLERGESSQQAIARGDGSIMAPTLAFIFKRTNSLGADHIGYLGAWDILRKTYRSFSKAFGRTPSPIDLTMAQVLSLSLRIQHLAKLPWKERIRSLNVNDLKPKAHRQGKRLSTADKDDFALDSEAWAYMSKVNWTHVLELSYNLFQAQQVVSLWGSRSSMHVAVATLVWAIQADTQDVIPSALDWIKELTQPYGGNEGNASRRRGELRDMLVGWSTSFVEAGLPIPILPEPKRGKGNAGTGLKGWNADARRAIPDYVMAIAAAPVVADNWQLIMRTRLATRDRALPLDTEYVMAAKMSASAYNNNVAAKKAAEKAKREQEKAARKAASAPASRLGSVSRGSSVVPEPRIARAQSSRPAHSVAGKSRDDILRSLGFTVLPQPAPSPSLEAMLATREDSSDDDNSGDSDDDFTPVSDKPGLGLEGVSNAGAFGFSIGPDGFTVADETDEGRRVPVAAARVARKRPPVTALSDANKRPRTLGIPMSPPPTSPSSAAFSAASREASPASTIHIKPSPRSPFYAATRSPSLRAVSLTPSLAPSSDYSGPVGIPESAATRHIGLLAREREQYAYWHISFDRASGDAVSAPVEAAMLSWLAAQQATGSIPQEFTPAYLSSIGVPGGADPRTTDLGPYLAAHSEWSSAEALLRAGLQPTEFPPHLIPHSLITLAQSLGHYQLEDRLAPVGESITEADLDEELAALFAHGEETVESLFCDDAEVRRRQQLYESTVWSFPRDVPEGKVYASHARGYKMPRAKAPVLKPRKRRQKANGGGVSSDKLEVDDEDSEGEEESHVPAPVMKTSTRINYDALRRLCAADSGDEEDEEMGGALNSLMEEAVWGAVGDRRGGDEYGDVDVEEDEDEAEE